MPAIQIIDNDDTSGYSDSGNLILWGGQGYKGDVREAQAGGATETASYFFSGLAPNDVYLVSTTYTPYSNRATDAAYSVSGVLNPGTVQVNQRQAPSDFQDAGVSWRNIGAFRVGPAGNLVVTISGTATGNVIADAVRIERASGPEIEVRSGSDAVADGASVQYGTVLAGASSSKVFTVENIGTENLVLQPLTVTGGFSLTSANFTPGQIVPPGGSVTFELTMDTSSGGARTGSVSLASNDGNENPFDLSLTGNVQAALIVDNGDANFTKTPGFGLYYGQGFQSDVHADNPGGNDVATWTFNNLPAGMYQVAVTWTTYPNREPAAPFTINGGTPILVNQLKAPSDPTAVSGGSGAVVTEAGVAFAELTVTATPVNGTITVQLGEGGSGQILADAVRLERLGPLHASQVAVVGLGPDSADIPSPTEIQNLLLEATGYWSTIDATAAERLADVQVKLVDLPDTLLGLGSFTQPIIWLDRDAAGHGWRVDGSGDGFGSGPGMDLLSVMTHELGHVLGHPDLDPLFHPGHVMAGRLSVGERRADLTLDRWTTPVAGESMARLSDLADDGSSVRRSGTRHTRHVDATFARLEEEASDALSWVVDSRDLVCSTEPRPDRAESSSETLDWDELLDDLVELDDATS